MVCGTSLEAIEQVSPVAQVPPTRSRVTVRRYRPRPDASSETLLPGSDICNVPERTPPVLGRNATDTVQVPPAIKGAVQLLVAGNSVTLRFENVGAAALGRSPVLVMVQIRGALVTRTSTSPNEVAVRSP